MTTALPPGEDTPFASVGFLLSQLGHYTSRRFTARLAELKIDPRQFAMLRHIEAQQGRSQQAIGQALQIPPSRMVVLVDDLEGRGLVERRVDPHDRRIKGVHLTPAGRELLQSALAIAKAHEADVCTELSATERDALMALLDRVARSHGLLSGVHPGLREDC